MNKVILMGRLTKDPETKYTATKNTAVCNFSIAVDRRFSKPGEEKQADFFNIVAWDKQAEFCSKYFTKGLKVVVVGRLQNRTWDDDEGKKHYVTEVVAEECHFAESKKGDGGNSEAGGQQQNKDNPPPEGQGQQGGEKKRMPWDTTPPAGV